MPIIISILFIFTNLKYSWSHILTGVAVLLLANLFLMFVTSLIFNRYNKAHPYMDHSKFQFQFGIKMLMSLPALWLANEFMPKATIYFI